MRRNTVRHDDDEDILPCNDEHMGGSGDTPEFYDFLDFKLLADRVVILNSDIDEWMAGKISRIFWYLAQTPAPITLLISSSGGSPHAGFNIIRAIQHAQSKGCPVTGEVRGYAFSMAAILLQWCDYRRATPTDALMIHGISGVTVGDLRGQKAGVELSNRLMDIIADYFATRNTSGDPTYHSVDYWRGLMDSSTPVYSFGQEALERGMLDELIV